MPPVFKNTLAIILGIMIGGMVNMGLITLGPSFIPPPAGADMMTTEGLAAAMPLMEFKHFVFPFLAHALGTLAGAFLAAKIAADKKACALVIGFFFLIGGITMVSMVPSPLWFTVLDLCIAYIPMAVLGWAIANKSHGV